MGNRFVAAAATLQRLAKLQMGAQPDTGGGHVRIDVQRRLVVDHRLRRASLLLQGRAQAVMGVGRLQGKCLLVRGDAVFHLALSDQVGP